MPAAQRACSPSVTALSALSAWVLDGGWWVGAVAVAVAGAVAVAVAAAGAGAVAVAGSLDDGLATQKKGAS
jgi:hypothetical protein